MTVGKKSEVQKTGANKVATKQTLARNVTKRVAKKVGAAGSRSSMSRARNAPTQPAGALPAVDDRDNPTVSPAPAWQPQRRAALVSEATGGTRAAAELLGVAPSQTSRWARGETVPAVEQARLLIDLEHVVAHALLLWSDVAGVHDWLTTPNGHLDGVRPLTWIRERGTAEVIDALKAEIAGAYA